MWLGWRTSDKLSGQKHWSLSCHLLPLLAFSTVKPFRTLATQCDHPSLSLELSFYLLSHSLDSLRPTKDSQQNSLWCQLDSGFVMGGLCSTLERVKRLRTPVMAGRKHVKHWVAVRCGRYCMSSMLKDTVCSRHFKWNSFKWSDYFMHGVTRYFLKVSYWTRRLCAIQNWEFQFHSWQDPGCNMNLNIRSVRESCF